MEKMNMDDLGSVSGGVAESYDVFTGHHTKNSQTRHVNSAIRGVKGLPQNIKDKLLDFASDHDHYLVVPARDGIDFDIDWEYNPKTMGDKVKINGKMY